MNENKEVNQMNTLQFASICLYCYAREAIKNPAYFIMFLSLVFVTHKLASWAAWVLSL